MEVRPHLSTPAPAQLQRRLQRERKARSDAEAIAEWGIRQLYDQQRQLGLLQAVATAANEATSPEAALQLVLDEVCRFAEWPVGHVYLKKSRGAGALMPTTLWHLDPPVERFDRFRQITESMPLTRGVGLPGRAQQSGKPAWIVDIVRDDNSPRVQVARELGVCAAFAFPVTVEREVAAVLEFFTYHPVEPDEALLALMTHVGMQLGRVIERQWAAQQLQESELRYRVISELTSDYAYAIRIEPNGAVVSEWIGGAVEQITGYTPDELDRMGGGFYLVHPEDVPLALQRVQRLVSGEADTSELRIIAKNGEVKWVRESGRPVVDGDGHVVSLFLAAQDVTERKRAEEQIRALNTELERRVLERTAELSAAIRELEAFSYSVSHDLRAPLRSLDGFSQALLEDYGPQLDDQARQYLMYIRHDSQRMGMLIDDLLRLARVARSEMHRDIVDLSDIARTVAAELQLRQPQRRVSFAIADGLAAHADHRLLRIVLTNLLENAWKYTSKHPTARIELGVTERDGEACYCVRDDGAGFDMQYASKLFRAFQRLHSAAEFEGNGIGLATVERIIRRHGGRVWVEATPEQGAAVYFTLGPQPGTV